MLYLAAAVFFIFMMTVFCGMETGLISLRKTRVRHGVKQKIRQAEILAFFLRHPGRMLATTLLGTNICVACASLCAKKAALSLGYETTSEIFVVTCVMSVILLAADILPKDWFRQAPYDRCRNFSYFLLGFYIIFYYPIILLAVFTDWISGFFSQGDKTEDNSRKLIREDLRILLRESEDAGIIDSEAAGILDNTVDFHNHTVAEIKTAKDKVLSIHGSKTIREAVKFCNSHNLSRIPVSAGPELPGKPEWVGVFSIYDAIFNVPEKLWDDMKVLNCLRPLTVVYEDENINEVLRKSRLSPTPLLVVCAAGDSGEQTGIVTPLDVVKSIFGDAIS